MSTLRRLRHPKRLKEAADFHPLAGIVPADRRKRGIEVQVFAYSGKNLLWAGVHYVPAISARAACRLENHWRRWRRWYDNLPASRARNYPSKEGPRAAEVLVVFPVDRPEARRYFDMPAAEGA